MIVWTITDPMSVMAPLAELNPDLLLVDMYMPGCTGLELAAVIRQQQALISIPIVFLSSETDIDKQMAAMERGGDDFLTKPILPGHLISAVSSRVVRLRELRSFMVRDSLTGLLNHTTIKEQLTVEIARAARFEQELAFALLDIDHFKLVNDTYGHPTGDRVLKSISRLLQQRLRKTDVIGRYGGEEFAIILPNTDSLAATQVIEELRAGFAQVRQQGDGVEFRTTFSAGIATYPRYADAAQLNNTADKALYRAKHNGRNRVVLAGRRNTTSKLSGTFLKSEKG
jgi:diguanylate cyclase (GGDEF)-like protein